MPRVLSQGLGEIRLGIPSFLMIRKEKALKLWLACSRSPFVSVRTNSSSGLALEGKAITDLHPAGTAFIDGKRVDVVSRGEYIEKDSDLLVTAVTANQIVVRKK